jgi:hypothetical protein
VDLVTIATFPDVPEAELAKERLQLEGIDAYVFAENTAGIMPYLNPATGGIRLQVEASDAERAKEILGS